MAAGNTMQQLLLEHHIRCHQISELRSSLLSRSSVTHAWLHQGSDMVYATKPASLMACALCCCAMQEGLPELTAQQQRCAAFDCMHRLWTDLLSSQLLLLKRMALFFQSPALPVNFCSS